MTNFLDVRHAPVGGGLAPSVACFAGTSLADYSGIRSEDLVASIKSKDVLIVAHGFNVDRAAGIASLSNWASLLHPPESVSFVGLLWPGDSVWAHGLDYPEEPKIANEAGELVAQFIDNNFSGAASISFASHSLGARVILQTINHLNLPVRRAILMAGAIDDNCLNTEFADAVAKVDEISLLSSNKDEVLSVDFPVGNFFAGIIAAGHPWWRAALGHCGPVHPRPENVRVPFEIPRNWKYQHGDYLHIDAPPVPVFPVPTDIPPDGSSFPALDGAGNPSSGWSEAFSSAFVSTRLR
jgi:hypothetical protein